MGTFPSRVNGYPIISRWRSLKLSKSLNTNNLLGAGVHLIDLSSFLSDKYNLVFCLEVPRESGRIAYAEGRVDSCAEPSRTRQGTTKP